MGRGQSTSLIGLTSTLRGSSYQRVHWFWIAAFLDFFFSLSFLSNQMARPATQARRATFSERQRLVRNWSVLRAGWRLKSFQRILNASQTNWRSLSSLIVTLQLMTYMYRAREQSMRQQLKSCRKIPGLLLCKLACSRSSLMKQLHFRRECIQEKRFLSRSRWWTRSCIQFELIAAMTDYWCFKCSTKSNLTEYGPCPKCKSEVMEEYSPASQAFVPYQVGQSDRRPSMRPQLTPFFGGMMPELSTFTRNFMAFNGDYIQRIEQNLINLLYRNSHRIAGNPPASQRAIDSLRQKQQGQCGVCGQEGGKGLILPCQHFFHKQCILRWLSMKNTCPICRYELQSCDPNYELNRQRNSQH